MALKIVHTADWHLGKRFGQVAPADERKLTHARLEAVSRVLKLANQHQVHAVLCAGDLFDSANPEQQWWEGLASTLRDHGNEARPVYLLPGNHDPLEAGSVYSAEHDFRQALPSWVHVVDRNDFEAELSPEALLLAVPCRSRTGADDPTKLLPPRSAGDDRLRIGMVHGQTFDHPGWQSNFPIRKEAAHELDLDYLAVGDTHSFREVPTGFDEPVVYPGTPEQTKFGEDAAGNAALVLFPRRPRRPRIRREQVGKYSWQHETITSMEAIRQLRQRSDLTRCVLKVTLDLAVSLKEERELRAALNELEGTDAMPGKAAALVLDEQRVDLHTGDLEDLVATLPSVLQRTVELLQAQQQGGDLEQKERATRALRHLYQELVRQGVAA